MLDLYLVSGIAIFIFMFTVFVIAQVIKDNSIVDIAWGFGFVIIALVSLFYTQEFSIRQMVVVGLVTLWGLRLTIFLWYRSIGRGEDFRYANFRKNWGKNAVIMAFTRVFMMQGAFMLIIAYPILRVHVSDGPGVDVFMILGAALWIIGFFFQVTGDAQLQRFKKRKTHKDQILTTGVWRYTRHPNYFGEAAMWWGIFIIVLPVELGWTAIFAPIFINFLLINVSGVPFLDERFKDNPQYQQYKKETNKFIPWFPKKANN
ncbi:DUF1295 domain-containing protein [Salisediminibacterium halotolerans]|uniref:Steroid 5-alpha reductase family enzyme n=1 Tax=Salisediminibacterium halotolerans TaxID=517425 RepID=A0A1H9W9V9_9BACI|nr:MULTISPECIES: DUF1295 domain-containing protein [Salisediminibacterium]RLJ72304.1 steroid 5-alpha reductase family enzyme [Actinophytocola xinjiangensis]RPE85518.1 steroid 5-alpha reductase family enzyme [Salisediminibacterium halotolerans]TWG33473.1 steroid 5-alpha reductase family enzyme [Salisediminibacterium halotolerans]SES30559.1 Steroid 5-alpha reductase family enzyme [Salisediminibacterium haloalkalitolerans]GEL07924.1 steroid 5-alpha reductase [Salisediminibacterium halotolerans]